MTQDALEKSDSQQELARLAGNIQHQVVEQWWVLAAKLVVRYNDHFFNFPENAPTTVGNIGYPAFWLEMIGYDQEFFRPHWFKRSPDVPSLLSDPAQEQLTAWKEEASSGVLQASWSAVCQVVLVVPVALATYLVGYRRGLQAAGKPDDSYSQLNA